MTAVLLAGQGPVVWALCADRVPRRGARWSARSNASDPRLPRWLIRVLSQDGRTLAQSTARRWSLDIGGAA